MKSLPYCFSGVLKFIFGILLTAIALAGGLGATNALAEKRVALVIENSSYVHSNKLNNPLNDARLIADKLSQLGFTIQMKDDLSARQFADVISDFSSKLDRDSVALFYYAGHGLQFRGENFLVGVDATLANESALKFETFSLNDIIDLLEGKAGTTIIFWDACRNNPLADELSRSLSQVAEVRSVGPLRSAAAPIPPRASDTLIVFSAAPGRQALDGKGSNSPFAFALSTHLATPNVEVETMLKRVTADVLDATKLFQRPERLSHLIGEFYFKREGNENIAQDEEIARLRAQLVKLENSSDEKKQYQITSAQDPAFKVALNNGSDVITRAGSGEEPTQQLDAAATSPSPQFTADTAVAPVQQETPAKPSIPGSPPPPKITVAVNPSAATIIRKLRISPDGRLLALGDDEGLVRIIQLDTFSVTRVLHAHKSRVSDLDFSPDSRTLLSAGRDGFLIYWDVESGQEIRRLSVPNTIPYSARINSAFPDRWVLMGDKVGHLIAWDLKKNDKVIMNAKFHNGPVLSVDYQPKGEGAFISVGGDGELKVRLPEGQRITLKAHDGATFQASYSSSGRLAYTVGSDRKIKIWETAKFKEGQPRNVLEGHLRYVLAANMSPDEKRLVSGGADKSVNLWDVESGQLIGHLQGHTADVEAVAFSPNGKFVVSSSEDQSVRIWSVENRQELVTMYFDKAGAGYTGVTTDKSQFGEKGSGLVSVYRDGQLLNAEDADHAMKYLGKEIAIFAAN
ncbi:MAG: caspase family protein [Proteobacteria bacterium]|nr:caspase family protein [Pseudomonadota bacterium]